MARYRSAMEKGTSKRVENAVVGIKRSEWPIVSCPPRKPPVFPPPQLGIMM